MTALMAPGPFSLLMIGTAFLSGIFGMAGGLILIGVLLVVFPLPTAMVLHAVTQMASNGWRATLWFRHIVWKSMAFYVAGCLVSVGLWSITLYVPDKAMALLLLGLSPFIVRAIPDKILPRSFGPAQVAATGLVSMMLMLLTGVTGPLLDTMFLRSPLERRQIIATKAACQVFGHGFKLDLLRRADRAGRPGRAVVPRHRRRLVDHRHLARQAAAREALRRAVPHLVEPADHGARQLLCRLRLGSAWWASPKMRRVRIPPGFHQIAQTSGFAEANGPWFEKIEGGRLIRGFRPGPQHANTPRHRPWRHAGDLPRFDDGLDRLPRPAAPLRHGAAVARLSDAGPGRRLAAGARPRSSATTSIWRR